MKEFIYIVLSLIIIIFIATGPALAKNEEENKPVVALALGGGAAWGFAHIGVLDLMEDYNIEPDLITGTSAGAVVAALYADGMSPAEIEELAADLNWRELLDAEVPDLGFFSPEGIEGFIKKNTAQDKFEDSPIELAFVASDLNTGHKVVLNSGSISRAVSASAAIPVLYRPVEYGDRLLVDGGLTDNLPSALAVEMGADIVIAVDLSSNFSYKGIPRNQFEVGIRSFNILQQNNIDYEDIDILIQPDLDGYRGTEMDYYDEIIEKGREAAKAAFEEESEIIDNLKNE